ncbi:MAG: hypothetical protein V4819_08815 [Verrucomicrobiota bacterium]
MKLEIRPESGFLRVDATGEFSLAEAKRTFLEMLEAAAGHQVRKVLFDGRGLGGAPAIMERFYYGEFAAKAVAESADRGLLSRSTKFGYVIEEPLRDPQRFGENVAVNRGMLVKTFDNLQDALEWLEILPANQPDPDDGK